MADQFDESVPNTAAEKEPAEGSRENVNLGIEADNPMERGSGQLSEPDKPLEPQPKDGRDDAGGITNRPLSREEEEQGELPPRGGTKHGGHAS